jgi:predicted alpha/beta-hydrolase family hydrolase
MTVRTPRARHLTIEDKDITPLSAILMKPRQARACFVFAHGAGAGMSHPFMEQVAAGLYARGIATLRYQFPFMEKGSKRPDSPALAHAAVRAAAAEARKRCRAMPLVAGGKSFGGRITSQAQALRPLAGVQGLAFLGFPLHPPDKPSIARAVHLSDMKVPMLFVQGTHDKLAEPGLLKSVTKKLGKLATVHFVDQSDHAFHVPARSGRTDADVISDLMDAFAGWLDRILGKQRRTFETRT